jgi:carboxymethylenebutenolidase
MDEAGVEHEVFTYPGAPHSFLDRGSLDHPDIQADAWNRVAAFIERNAS